MVFVPEVFRPSSSDSKMLSVPELLNGGGPPTWGPAVSPGKSARFTSFTSTKVQILTPTRGPAVSPDDEFNGTNANGAGVADGQRQNREDEAETRGFDTCDAEALERQRARKCCVWSKDDVAVGGTSQVFRDANGEWIVGIKVKLNLLQVLTFFTCSTGARVQILTHEELLLRLQEHLHIAYRMSPWRPLYNASWHGASCATLLRLVKGRSPCFLVVKDSRRHVFGAYLPLGLRSQHTPYGTGQALIFSLHPSFRVFGSNGCNYILSSERGIALGGVHPSNTSAVKGGMGSLGVGLYVDSDLFKGSSMACSTFGNTGSLASGEDFECVQIEVWALVTPAMSEESAAEGAALLGKYT
jgi:hypothetical protein